MLRLWGQCGLWEEMEKAGAEVGAEWPEASVTGGGMGCFQGSAAIQQLTGGAIRGHVTPPGPTPGPCLLHILTQRQNL